MYSRLSKGQIQLLLQLIRQKQASIAELNRRVTLRKSTVSRELSRLQELGFVSWNRKARTKYVQLSDRKHATLLRNMVIHSPNLRYEILLTGKSIDILAAVHLLHLTSIREIEEFSNTSHVTTVKHLSHYRRLGAVAKSEDYYHLGVRYKMLGDFLGEYQSYINRQILTSEADDAAIVWERDTDMLLLSLRRLEKPFQQSAFTTFPKFGIDVFLGDNNYYFYSPRKVQTGVEEVLVHSMLAIESPRERTLILLLMLKRRPEKKRLLKLGRIYKSRHIIQTFLDYIENKGTPKPQGFPSWSELSQKMVEYA